jgi:ribosomal protein S18 acetylase RimI-like enzyme
MGPSAGSYCFGLNFSTVISLELSKITHIIRKMKIKKINRFSHRVFSAVLRFLPQLGQDSDMPDEERFKTLLKSKGTSLFIIEIDNKEIAGMLTLVNYTIPTGRKIWIEDVVVDEAHRGKGYGRKLMLYAIEQARSAGAKSIELTSRPSRIEANQLYRKLGFIIRETNVYRYPLKKIDEKTHS